MSDMVQRKIPTKGRPSYFEFGYDDTDDESDAQTTILHRKAPFILQSHRHGLSGIDVFDFKFARRQKQISGPPREAEPRLADASGPIGYPKIYSWLGVLVFILIGGGIIATAVRPSAITQLGVPLGFTLWAVLASLLRGIDRRRLNA